LIRLFYQKYHNISYGYDAYKQTIWTACGNSLGLSLPERQSHSSLDFASKVVRPCRGEDVPWIEGMTVSVIPQPWIEPQKGGSKVLLPWPKAFPSAGLLLTLFPSNVIGNGKSTKRKQNCRDG